MKINPDGSTAQPSVQQDAASQQAAVEEQVQQARQHLAQMEANGGPKTAEERQVHAMLTQLVAHTDAHQQLQQAVGVPSAGGAETGAGGEASAPPAASVAPSQGASAQAARAPASGKGKSLRQPFSPWPCLQRQTRLRVDVCPRARRASWF